MIQMKNKFLKGLVASFALVVSGFANAGLITLTDTQEQTVDFEDFNFSFAIDDWLAGTSAEL